MRLAIAFPHGRDIQLRHIRAQSPSHASLAPSSVRDCGPVIPQLLQPTAKLSPMMLTMPRLSESQ